MSKIIVTTPVYRSEAMICPETTATVHALRDAGMCATPEWFIQPGPLVFQNRNKAIRHALMVPGWTHLLTLDADVSLPEAVADVELMISRGRSIVCGSYTMRWEDGPEVICAARLGVGHVKPGAAGLHAVDWAGAGCMLITRPTLEDLGPLWFQHITLPDGSDQTPEDVGFCQHARENGYQIWLDCDVHAVHHNLPGGNG